MSTAQEMLLEAGRLYFGILRGDSHGAWYNSVALWMCGCCIEIQAIQNTGYRAVHE